LKLHPYFCENKEIHLIDTISMKLFELNLALIMLKEVYLFFENI
jgi:hypothetical protein